MKKLNAANGSEVGVGCGVWVGVGSVVGVGGGLVAVGMGSIVAVASISATTGKVDEGVSPAEMLLSQAVSTNAKISTSRIKLFLYFSFIFIQRVSVQPCKKELVEGLFLILLAINSVHNLGMQDK